MTRRVRFSPFLRAGIFAAALCIPEAAQALPVPLAPPQPVSTEAQFVPSLASADVDRDGDLDLLVADGGNGVFGGRVLLLRNTTGGGGSWSSVVVSTAGASPRSVAAADVDGDGDVDAVSASLSDDEIHWHENVGGTGAGWVTHTIATVDGAIAVAIGDIDRDGDVDVVAVANEGQGALRYYQNQSGGSAWITRTVGTPGYGMRTVALADIDRDGDLDVLAGHEAGGPAWYENTGGGTAWTLHLTGTVSQPLHIAAADIDRDGDLDVVQAQPSSSLTWHENVAGPTWPTHTVATPGGGVERAVPADVDGDGDVDLWVVRGNVGGFGGIDWYENVSGNGLTWTRRFVATQPYSTAIAVADLDGDGDPDGLSVSGFSGATIVRHTNETLHRNACFGPPVTISTMADTPHALTPADIDRDGDVDLVTAHETANALLWHESTAAGANWTPHTLTTATSFPTSVATADVDRDGDPDVVAGDNPGLQKRALWFENTPGGAMFPPHTIATGLSAYLSHVTTGDIDGDGDVDAFQASKEFVGRWYANTSGNGSAWAPGVTIGGTSGELVDIDGDGDLDVASAYADFSGLHNVGWRENVAGTGAAWSMHTISTAVSWPFVITAGDLDGDGDVDFAHGGLESSALRWRINEGAGASWSLRTVDGAGLGAKVADLDGDGDLDLPWGGGTPLAFGWHENRNDLGSEWLAHTLPFTASPGYGAVEAADIDRDGDVDLVANAASLVWSANQGGQFSLAADNTAPGTADQGSTVSMLRVAATHLGRDGDGPLELARFGVLLEEAAGDPLTSAEANLLIESLRVYRDANGNGIFEPTDTLVASIGTLSLAAGVQDIPFADGDPNVAVAFGAPRTYFVVVELTADAATQNPNRVRTTLLQLGPSASQAQHADYDLLLAPACPADVSSVVMVATVPVELMGFTIE